MYNIDFEALQRNGDNAYYGSLCRIKRDYNAKLKTLPVDDIYRDQLIANLVMVELEIDHIDKVETEQGI